MKAAQDIVGIELPSLEHLYSIICMRGAKSIIKDITHLGHHLFKLLPTDRHFRTIQTCTDLKSASPSKAILNSILFPESKNTGGLLSL